MISAERRASLLKTIQSDGFVTVAEVSTALGVTAATIRRDLDHLAKEGLVVRSHGGAAYRLGGATMEIPYSVKRGRFVAEKTSIGALASSLVRDGDTIICDSGSTVFQLATHLRGKRRITVVTNDLQVMIHLAAVPEVQVVVPGGVVNGPVYTLLGPQTEIFLRTLTVDRVFLGGDAIDLEAGITNVNLVEVAVKQAMIGAAREVVVLADSSKFDHRVFARVCGLEAVTRIVTDQGLSDEARRRYGDRVELLLA